MIFDNTYCTRLSRLKWRSKTILQPESTSYPLYSLLLRHFCYDFYFLEGVTYPALFQDLTTFSPLAPRFTLPIKPPLILILTKEGQKYDSLQNVCRPYVPSFAYPQTTHWSGYGLSQSGDHTTCEHHWMQDGTPDLPSYQHCSPLHKNLKFINVVMSVRIACHHTGHLIHTSSECIRYISFI